MNIPIISSITKSYFEKSSQILQSPAWIIMVVKIRLAGGGKESQAKMDKLTGINATSALLIVLVFDQLYGF